MEKETVVELSMKKINIAVFVVILLLFIGFCFLHVWLHGRLEVSMTLNGLLLFIALYVFFILFHEALHLCAFHWVGHVEWKKLKWGVNWKLGVAYAHSTMPVTVKQMKWVLFMPFVPTAVIPLLFGLIFNSPSFLLLGIFMVAGCLGDYALYQKLKRFSNKAKVIDHLTKPQFTVYE
ncbi:DUF3267 domain-containing protein [Peribacillus loiseleuriae]|uniref:Diaminopimelate epimerase n=1 Tax=Peribacillus loiseleuriae TaxID=1679170 RepID=A0A0K9GP20_9BACI|nr:DUF3267 domain-containing protein [Peribacillus loiseleuriae]KMY48341.1 diaminopimelate epimerase [Peribacillus loiseleuriae]